MREAIQGQVMPANPPPSTVLPRITGKAGALYIYSTVHFGAAWVKVADLYNWRVDFTAASLPCPTKGDYWTRKTVGLGDGYLRAERFVTAASVLANSIRDTLLLGERYDALVFAVDNDNNPNTNAYSYVQLSGYVTHASMEAPRGMFADQFEMALDTFPVIV